MTKTIKSKKYGEFVINFDDENEQLYSNHNWRIFKCGNVVYVVANDLKKKGGLLYFHRIVVNATKGQIVDHINGDGCDNRKENLRICTNQQNVFNGRKCNKETSSQYKGVNWDKEKKRWRATIRSKIVGRFKTEVEAALCYNKFAQIEFGQYARLNEI